MYPLLTAALLEGTIPSPYWLCSGFSLLQCICKVIVRVCNQYFPIVLCADICTRALMLQCHCLSYCRKFTNGFSSMNMYCVVSIKSTVPLSDYTALGVVGAKDLSCSLKTVSVPWYTGHMLKRNTLVSPGVFHIFRFEAS